MEKAWIKLMGFTSTALNRNFFIATLMLVISYSVFATIKYFELTKELTKEKTERLNDSQKVSKEKQQMMADCDTTVTRLINTYTLKVEGLYEKRLNDLKR